MHYTYDPTSDALYVYLTEDGVVAKTETVDENRKVDLDLEGKVVGIEILVPSEGVLVADLIDRYQLASFKEFLESVSTTTFKTVVPSEL